MNVYEEAIKVLDRTGWSKGEITGRAGTHCVAGAVLYVDYENPLYYGWEWIGRLAKFLPEGFSSVPDYNDHPDTTEEDIRLLLKRAAYEEEERG